MHPTLKKFQHIQNNNLSSSMHAFLSKYRESQDSIKRMLAPITARANAISQKLVVLMQDENFADHIYHNNEIENVIWHRYHYAQTGNPQHAWKAIKIARECPLHKLPIWAVNAITERAAVIVGIESSEASTSIALKKALGINGHMIKEFKRLELWREKYFTIIERHDNGETYEQIFADMGENDCMSNATLKNQFYAYQKAMEKFDYRISAFGA